MGVSLTQQSHIPPLLLVSSGTHAWVWEQDTHSLLLPPLAGELERADHWKDRFRHLNHSMHNYLRITRILKSLGEFQYEHFKGPFVRFVLHEAIVKRTLTRTLDSCMNYWVEVIRDDEERGAIRTWAEELAQKS